MRHFIAALSLIVVLLVAGASNADPIRYGNFPAVSGGQQVFPAGYMVGQKINLPTGEVTGLGAIVASRMGGERLVQYALYNLAGERIFADLVVLPECTNWPCTTEWSTRQKKHVAAGDYWLYASWNDVVPWAVSSTSSRAEWNFAQYPYFSPSYRTLPFRLVGITLSQAYLWPPCYYLIVE